MNESAFPSFVTQLLESYPVVAPVAKKSRFVFAELETADELRLDYDTTILPPKKIFSPTKQSLLRFDQDGFQDCIAPRELVLLGVHPYDIKAIGMSDCFFRDNFPDINYLAQRDATIIVGSNVRKHYKHAFFGTVATEVPVTGHDMFLTNIDDGYVVEILTEKGRTLGGAADLVAATDAQVKQAEKTNRAALANCPEELNHSSKEIRKKVRASFLLSQIWKDFSEDCFSCGSCNTVCPTCFCFDVQDEWHIDGKSGVRYRTWDACLATEFAEVSVQGGCENFRAHRWERFRHRFMRKTAYLNDQLGGPACVGCGRCSGACTADIANPTTVINKIMERKA